MVFPTETVYGLGARADSAEAVGKVFAAKNRPADNPLIIHVDSMTMAETYAYPLGEVERALLKRFSPGPLTVIADRMPSRAEAAAAGQATIGLRIPSERAALKLITALGGGIAAPSANRSGRPSPTDFTMAWEEMAGRVSAIIEGGPSVRGLESTIIRIQNDRLYVLRLGSLSVDDIRNCVMDVRSDVEIRLPGEKPEADTPAAPGTRYRHYAPRALVRLFSNAAELSLILRENDSQGTMAFIMPSEKLQKEFADQRAAIGESSLLLWTIASLDDYRHRLYRFLAEADRHNAAQAVCWMPPKHADSLALRDRLRRAAAAQ